MKRSLLEERCKQILRWCEATWPTPYPVKMVWKNELLDKEQKFKKDQPYHGETFLQDGVLKIVVSRVKNSTYSIAIDTVLHEYAHCMDWRHARVERGSNRIDHGPEWGIFYAKVYHAFHHDNGDEDSREF